MPTIADIMTRDVQPIGPEDTQQSAAQLMDQLNVGSLPVVLLIAAALLWLAAQRRRALATA